MIDLSALRGQRIAVMGLGKTGLSAARALYEAGVEVCAWDDVAPVREAAAKTGLPIMDLQTLSFENLNFILWSPGISHRFPKPHPVAVRARENGIPVVCDIELLCRVCSGTDLIAVTGTNGKSTTTALIGHILKGFRPTEIGGNIGKPVLTLERLGSEGCYVIEMSSYQLELTPSLSPVGAVLLNITPDHLGRHGGLEGYIAAKELIFANPPVDMRKPTAVVCIDSEPCVGVVEHLREEGLWSVIPVSTCLRLDHGVYAEDGVIYEVREGEGIPVVDLRFHKALRGQHNHENVACAYALIRHVYGYEPNRIEKQIASFGGLPHRQYRIRTINGVSYINDSKATNADATSRALACFNRIYWILGGQAKEGGLSGLEPYMNRIEHAYLIGEATVSFAKWLQEQNVPYTVCGTLDRAVAAAHARAQSQREEAGSGTGSGGGTVLLSPACASWDQFSSFEHRGDVFTSLVNGLTGKDDQEGEEE